ncbi:hypothetical protein [Streptomyces sp. NBC_00503]|uniref:hypothetical protein n=1 Tax=Streptomyces sp. NBC_00503 TaxID=2903659 RepID=UPI002E811EFC|nr:hypothetical protein [Streptomyces sp. NBC_00503]WUD84260.1 hypothetical protein OG490_28940 [Streptomyces sp. NBC_00503]
MKPLSRTVRIRVDQPSTVHVPAFHPPAYEILDADEIRELVAAWPAEEPPSDMVWMCLDGDTVRLTLYEAGGQRIRSLRAHGTGPHTLLLDPRTPGGIPYRHRAHWAAAAPGPLRGYAGALARGDRPAPPPGIPSALVFTWLGAARARPTDAARRIADEAPLALLAEVPTEELAWAVRETDRAGLEGAVRFFAGEHFTTRHPKRRRVPDTARDLLIRHARSHRPQDLPVLERRLLRAPDDRVRRS